MKVLIPTELSEESILNIKKSIAIFDKPGTVLNLVYYLEIFVPQQDFLENEDQVILNYHKDKMNKLVLMLKTLSRNAIDVSGKVVYGLFKDAIKTEVRENKYDLLLMFGSKRVGLENLFMKSKTKSILGEVSAPLLYVPTDVNELCLDKLGLAIDKSEKLTDKVENEVANLKSYFASEVFPFHINDFTENQEELQKYKEADSAIATNTRVIDSLSVQTGVREIKENLELDVIGVVTHDKNFFEKLFIPSFTRKLIQNNKALTLVFQS